MHVVNTESVVEQLAEKRQHVHISRKKIGSLALNQGENLS